jgi:hypothetical protein
MDWFEIYEKCVGGRAAPDPHVSNQDVSVMRNFGLEGQADFLFWVGGVGLFCQDRAII